MGVALDSSIKPHPSVSASAEPRSVHTSPRGRGISGSSSRTTGKC